MTVRGYRPADRGQIELILDLADPARWRAVELLAGRDFRG